jgi:hypothetical protein
LIVILKVPFALTTTEFVDVLIWPRDGTSIASPAVMSAFGILVDGCPVGAGVVLGCVGELVSARVAGPTEV